MNFVKISRQMKEFAIKELGFDISVSITALGYRIHGIGIVGI